MQWQLAGTRKTCTRIVTECEVSDTVDGRSPAPVDRWFIPLFIRFYMPGG